MEYIEDMLELIKKKIAEQGAYDREAYHFFVDETIQYYKEKGLLSDDDNEDYIEKTLLDLYPEVKEQFLEEEV